jgi:DNA-binding NtrC family response regulator
VKRILVIDADAGERLIVRSRMIDLGLEVVTAESGAQGLAEARSGQFNIILLAADLAGGVDSNEVCKRLKAVPQLASVPVIIYTNQACTPEVGDRAFAAGCEAFMPKSMIGALDRVVAVMLRMNSRQDELTDQNKVLEISNRRLGEDRQRLADMETSQSGDGGHTLVHRELAAGRPDGVLVVDASGFVRYADRGACELLGTRLEGKNLGSLAPNSGLEAFVRDARSEAREGFRFDISPRKGRAGRAILASVVPVTVTGPGDEAGMRIALLLDIGKRRVAEEMLRTQEPGIPRHQLGTLLEAARTMFSPEAVVGRCEASVQLRRRLIEVSRTRGPVMISGERGSGKEFVARILHYAGTATGPFLQLRCSALSAESLENELFGYAKGAFPGAIADRPGLFSLARDGTLYLGEISELPMDLQARLLEALERGSFTRRGAGREEPVELRLIAASSRDLNEMVESGRFLPRLQSFLSGSRIQVPPMRERLIDLPVIAQTFVERFGSRLDVHGIEEGALWVMQQYDWPGNFAELEDCIEQASNRAQGHHIGVAHLTRPLRDLHTELPDRELVSAVRRPSLAPSSGEVASGMQYDTVDSAVSLMHRKLRPWDITEEDPISLDLYEKKALLRALDSCNGDKLAAARLLNVGKSTLYRKLKRFGIT